MVTAGTTSDDGELGGSVTVTSGGSTGTGASGAVTMSSSDSLGSGVSGAMVLSTGTTEAGSSA